MDKSDLVKFRSECISAHNFYRSLHGTTPLVWSTRLADGAQKWAEQLASADSLTYSQERGIGENIACLWGSNVTGNKVTQIWYEESQNYDYSAPRVTPNNRPFCQVVWEGTRELGAGKASTKNGKQVVVARYHPPASRKQVEKNVKSPKIDGSTALTTRTSVGLRKFQEECLFAHNEFRVLHGAPPLHWSPSLAWAAQQWAEELAEIGELKHNNDEMVGENLAGMVGDELTGKECTDMWYEEVNEFNFENPCYSEETSNFTQVVWIGSELLGVGRAKIADTCIVVAFYEPPGNIEGSFGANVRLQGTKVKTYRLTKEMKTFIPPSPDLEWFRIECLVAHNYFRARHGAPPLVIGQALNEEAQYWAERLLVTGATEDLEDSRIGINVAVIHGHHVSGLKVTELWYDEGTGYNFESPGFSLSTRSFTQLIWLTSRKLGIGKATNNSGQCVIVARYEPVGNIDGLFVANIRRRGDERNGLEPMIFESDVKYRFKVEGRRSFRMSWEIEGTQTLQAVDKTRDKTRRKEQAQPAYLSSPETFTRLVWIESPVLPRKQMRESCDLDMEKSDDDKESGVEEGEEFEQEEPSLIVVQPIAEATETGKQCERAIVYTEPQRTDRYPDVRRSLSLDSEGTEPEPEEGRVLSRVAYFEHFERIEKDKLDRPKRSSIEVTEQVRHEQFQDEEAKSHKLSEHEEAVRQLEYDDVFPKHDENDERDDDFASEGEAEDDDDDVMSLETVSEAEEDLLEELDEYEMDHHIKSYCYEVNYPREEDEMNVNNDETTDERGQIADIIETELDRMDKEQDSLDPDHFVASSADRDGRAKDEMRVVDTHIEFVPIQVVKRRKDFNPDDVIFDETEEDKELFKYEIKTPEKEKPARPLCTESVSSQTRDRVECELNFDEMFSRMDKTEKPKGKPPPTLPKPKRKLKEEAPTEPRTDIIRTLETKQIVDTVHRIKTEPEPVTVQKEEIVETSKHVTEEKPAESKSLDAPSQSRAEMIRTLETKQTVESVHRVKTEPEPTVQKEEIVETSKHVTEEKPAEPKLMETPSESRAEMIRTLETKQTVESVHRIKTEPEPTVQKEEIVESSKHVTEEKPAEPKHFDASTESRAEMIRTLETKQTVESVHRIKTEPEPTVQKEEIVESSKHVTEEKPAEPKHFDASTESRAEMIRTLETKQTVESVHRIKTEPEPTVQKEEIVESSKHVTEEKPAEPKHFDASTESRAEMIRTLETKQTVESVHRIKTEPEPTVQKEEIVESSKHVTEEKPAEPKHFDASTESRAEMIRTLETKQTVESVHRIKTEPEPTVQKEEIVESSKHVTEEKPAEPKHFDASTESRAEMIRTLETKQTVESVHRIKTEPEPTVQKEEIVESSKHVTEEKPAEPKHFDASTESRAEMIRTLETKQTVESVHRIKTEPEPTVQKEEIVESSKHVTDEKPAEPKLVGAESKEQLEEAPCSDEETFESFDVSFIDRERKLKNIFKRLGRRIELIPTTETITTPREFDRNTDLSETKEEEELFRVYDAPIVDRTTRNKNPVQEETILAEYRKRDVESEIDFEEMFERLEKGEETPSKEPVLELTQGLVVLESERAEEEPQEEKAKAVRFDKTVIFQEHESVHKEFVELREEGAASEEYEDVEAESALDFEDHCEEFEEVDEARTEEREQITPASPVHLAHECEEPSELFADTSDQEEEEVESYGEEEEVRTSVSPMDEEETSVQFSEELSERSNSYGNCEVDTIEPRNSVADVYEEYEPTPVSDISEMSSSRPIHVAADIDNQPLESGVEEKSVRTTMYESFEEVLPDAFVSPVIEPSTCYIAAELNHHTTEVEPVEEVVEMAALSSDEEPETIEKIGVRGIPESTESTVCITTETTFHHRTEIVQKRAPSIEVEMPLEKEESIEEEPIYKEILPNGHCTSVYISRDIDGEKTEIITETESYETEIPQTFEEEKVAVSELQSNYEIPSNISVQSQRQQEENVEENVKEEEVEQLEEAVPVTEDVEETVEEREEEKEEETVEEEEEVEQIEEAVPVTDELEETFEEREDEKEEETVEEEEEAEQHEEAVPVTDEVEETVEKREDEKEEETVEEEEEVEQIEEAVRVTDEVEETVEEREDEKEEETVEEEEEVEQIEEAVPVTDEVEETVEEREDEKEEETVEEEEEVEQIEEAVPVTDEVEETVEEREDEKEEETVEEEEEVEQIEEAVPVTDEVEETAEESEEQKEEEPVKEEEEEEEQLEEAVPVTDKVEETVEQKEEEKEEETVEEEEEVEQIEEAVPVTDEVEKTVEEREEVKEEKTVEEEKEVEQLEEAVPVTDEVEETVEEREEEKEEETVEEEEEEAEQLEEAVPVTEDVEDTVEEREEEKEEETVEKEKEFEQLEDAVPVTDEVEETIEEREEEKEEETVEEEKEVEQLEEAVPVTDEVEETIEEREEEKEEETVEEEEKAEQLEEAVPVTEDVEETAEEKGEEKVEETVEEEEEVEQLEEAVPVTDEGEETVQEREEEKEEKTVLEEEEVEQLEEAVPVTDEVGETVEEREEEKEEETVEEEEEAEQLEEAAPVTEDVVETVEEKEEEKEEETVEEEEEVEQLEEAVPVTEDVEVTVEEREEEKEEETVEEEEKAEQFEQAVPVTDEVEETVEEQEEEKEEEVEQLEEAVPDEVEETVEEREEEKEEETVVEEEEVEQLEEAVPVTEDVEETVEEREEQKQEEIVEEEEETEQLEEAVPVTQNVEEMVEEREEQKEDETVEEVKEHVTESKQEGDLEFPDGSEKSEEREQVEEAEKQQVVDIEKSQTLVVDDRFEYISEEELEETEELYEALKESFEEQDNEELIDEENVRVQQTAARIIHIDSQEEENYEAFGEEASEDEIVYDTEVITEVEKEITSALVVKESFSSAVCEDETANENVHPEERETESPVEETQAKTLLQFSEPADEDGTEEYVDEREPMDLHDDSDDVFMTEEQFEPSKTPDIEECEELESSDEIIDKEVELIQFTEETVEEEKVTSGDEEVFQEEKAVSESEERSPTPDEEDERDDLDSSEEFAEENIELIQFDEQVDEDKAIDEGSEVDELYPLSPDVIEEKQIVNESGVELIQFTEQVEEERVKDGERMESPELEHVESEGQQDDEQITDEKTEHIQFVEHTEEIESTHTGQAEEMLKEYVTKDSGKIEVEEELVISQPIACSTPIFLDEKEQSEDTTSFDDSAEAGYGEKYEDMENIVAHDHSLDVSQSISLEESSDLSNDFYKAEAEETASKAVAEEFDDSGRQETEPESLEEVENEKEETSVTSSSVVTTTVYEKRIIKTEHTKREFVDFTPLETAEAMRHKESREEHLSPPPKITATEFVAAEEEEGSEEEYLPNFEHPRTYMIESKEVVMDRNAVESKFVEQEESAPLKELEKEEHEEPAVGIQAPSEMDTGIETEVIETEPQKVETRTTTVSVSHRSEVVRKQQSDIDDLEEKELEERIQRKQKAMEEKLLQDEIKEDIPDKRISESEESRTEPIFTSISVVKVAHEDDEQRIFREEDATIKMSEDEEKLKEEESSTEEQDVKEDEALTEAAFRAEREEEERKAEDTSDEPDRGQREDEVAQVPIIPLMTASYFAYKTARSEKEIHEDYQEEVVVERIESKTHPVVLTDVDFTEEIEVEKMQEELEVEEDSGKQDVYEEEVEIQRVENQEEQFIEEYHDDVFEEEVLIERIEEEHEEEQESSPDAASLLVYEEELEVAADQIPEQPNPAEVNVVQAEPLHEDAGQNNVGQNNVGQNNDGQNNADENDAGEDNVGENNEVGQVEEEEQAWEEYEEMEEQDQEIPQEIQGIAVQGDMHLYDNNNNESLPRYYVDFSPGGSFEHESTTSDDGEGPEVYRQGEPMEEDMEEFILVKYEDQSSSSEEDISDHREMYVIHEEDSEDRADEKKEMTEESHEEKVAYDQGFVNPALEDIREEEEEEKQKHHQGEGEEVDIEEKLQLEEYERLESFVILEEKLSQVESDESIEDLTSGTDGKRASSEETLNDEDELSETRTSSTLKDGSNSKDDASGDEASTPETQPSALDTTLTKEVEEETIDLEDGGVLSKRTVREESYSIEEDDGDDDDKDKTLTRKKISKKVITTTSTSETHVKRIESEDNPSPSGSDNESEHQKEHAEDVTTKYTTETEQPEKQFSGDEKSRKEIDESPEYGTKMIETEQETIDLDDGGVMNKFVTREETYTVEEGNGDGHDDQDSSISRKTVSKKIVTTTTTSTSRVTRLEDEPSSFSDDDANRVVETSSEETHTTIIKSRQPEEPLVTAKRQLSLENYGASSEACKDPSRKRRGFLKRFDSHESEGHSSEVSSTTDSTGESTSISSEGHVSDEDFSGLDEFQIDCIRQHNIYRHRHRACRLLWSEDLAAAAAQWADHLAATKTLDHSPQKECGENLACAKGYDLRGDKVADMWYEEINDYNFEIPAFNAKCGHFTQMIWRGTKEFGVAKTIADDGSQYVVARYNPPGNILGEFKDSIRRSRGQKTNVRKRRRSSTRRQLSHSSDMSNVLHREKFKNECVISHNYYRSLHGAPPLKWSTMLANEAQTFAEKLTKSGSFMHSGSKEIGECLAFSFGLDLSGRDAVDTWYDEIVDYDYEYPGYTSHTANFTQVVWAGSKEFGMGKAIGDDGSCVVVGKYYPPGNIVGDFQENVKQKGTGF